MNNEYNPICCKEALFRANKSTQTLHYNQAKMHNQHVGNSAVYHVNNMIVVRGTTAVQIFNVKAVRSTIYSLK